MLEIMELVDMNLKAAIIYLTMQYIFKNIKKTINMMKRNRRYTKDHLERK